MFAKTFCSIMLLFAATVLLYADSFSFKASVDKKTVPLDESFTYSITASTDGKNLPKYQISDIPEFTRYGASISQSMSITNGEASMSATYEYTLGPKRTGKFTIPPAKVTCNGRTYLTKKIEVEVTPAKSVGSQSVQNISSRGSQKSASNPALVRASVNKKTVYENEKLVCKSSFFHNNADFKYYIPDFSGFWNDGSKHKSPFQVVIDGSNCYVDEIETVLYSVVGTGFKTIMPTKLIVVMPDARDDFLVFLQIWD
jgi:hypothetical protein